MARIKFRKLIDDYTKKGHRNPLRAAVEERVRSDYVIRNRRSRVDDSVDALLAIEKVEGETLKSVLKDDHVWSIVVDHYIPKELGYDSALSNEFMHDIKQKVDKIPPKFEDFYPPDQFSKEAIKTKFDEQFEEVFGKPPFKPPKKAAGGVVSLYNRPKYGLGGDIWEGIKGSKIGDLAKWGYNLSTEEGRKKAEEARIRKIKNQPLVYPQMSEQQFKDYQGEDYLNKLLEMESEMIPQSSVIDTRPGTYTGFEQIYPDINALMTNMPPTEREDAVVENYAKGYQPMGRYDFHYIDPEQGGMPIGAEEYYEYQKDPEKRMSTYIIDQMGPIHNYLDIGNKELDLKVASGEITEDKYNKEVKKLYDKADVIHKKNNEWYDKLEKGEITQNEYDLQMSQQAENLRSIQDFLPSQEMEGPMASEFQPFNPLAQDPNHPLYNYEMATRFGTNQDLGYEMYPGSEGYGDRYAEDLIRLGGNTAAQFMHFLVGEGINLSFALSPTVSHREGEMPEFWAEEVRKQGGNPEGLLEKFVGLGGAADMLSGLGGWLLNKDWDPKFAEKLKDKDWRWWDDRTDVISISEHEAAELGVEPGTYLPSEEDPSKPDLTKRISHGLFDPHGGVQSLYNQLAEKWGWKDRDMRDYQYQDIADYETTGISPNTRYGDTGVGSYQWLHPGQGYQDWIDPEYYDEETGRGKTFETPIIDWMGTSQVGPMAFFARDIPRQLAKLSPHRLIKTKSGGTFSMAQLNKDLERFLKYQKAGIKPPGRLKQLYEAVTRAGTGRKTTDEFVDDLVKAIDVDAAATKKIEPPEKKKKKKKKKKPEEKKKSTIITHDPDYIGNAQGGMVDVRDMTGAL